MPSYYLSYIHIYDFISARQAFPASVLFILIQIRSCHFSLYIILFSISYYLSKHSCRSQENGFHFG